MPKAPAKHCAISIALAAELIWAVGAVTSGQTRALALTNATIIDASSALPRPSMTVVVRDGHIESVGNRKDVRIPAGAQVVDLSGKFLIPGLWDMHVHLTDAKASAIPALVANGVTGVRDMGSLLPQLDDWRARINSGALIGPHIIRAGPILNGRAFGPTHLAVADAGEARAAVRTLAKIGVDFIKIHATLTRDEFLAIAEEAKQAGLPFVGHIPGGVTPAEVSGAGQASIEHTESLFVGTPYVQMSRDEMFAAMADLFRRFARNGTRYTPTLVMYKASADWRGFAPHAQTKYVARSAQEVMLKSAEQYKNLPDVVTGRMRVLGELVRLVGMMREQGVKVMAGTDLSDGRIFPGYSIHEELALLVDAGFTPGEAIAAATRVPAEFMKMDDVGLIAPLKRPDMVVLTANPLADIHNTMKIDSVVLNGRLLKRTQLDALLAESARLATLN